MAKVKEKKSGRSGFLFLFLILLLLGVIIYYNREKFLVLSETLFDQGKEYVYDKIKKGNTKEKEKNIDIIKKIDKIEKKYNPPTTPIVTNTKEKSTLNKKGDFESKKIENNNIQTNITKNNILTKEEVKKNTKEVEKKVDNQNVVTKNTNTSVKQKNETSNNIVTKNSNLNEKSERAKSNSKIIKIYYTKIDTDDNLVFTSIPKKVTYSDSPLTETMKILLDGPSKNEESLDIVTNIPKNTKLLSIKIVNNIAYINFSRDFEYNQFGREATLNQLKQIVFTATEFPNIKSVQFLIDGKTKTYLGGEGIMIDRPLTRNDFS